MNGLKPHFFAGGVPLSRADFPGSGTRDLIAFTLAISTVSRFLNKDDALEYFYSEADRIYQECEQEILSRACQEKATPSRYNLTEHQYRNAESLPVDFYDRGLIYVSYCCPSTDCSYQAKLTIAQYEKWKADARKVCHHLNPCDYETPMSPEKALAEWLRMNSAIAEHQGCIRVLSERRMGCEFQLIDFCLRREPPCQGRYLIALGDDFFCLEFDAKNGRIEKILEMPFLSKQKASDLWQSET